jgi:drug/metabolite transporter (DMT)-like permease
MFEVLISLLILRRHVDKNAIIGVFFGIVGTVFTSLGSGAKLDISTNQLVFIAAILTATCSYAGASLYINSKCKQIEPMAMATGSALFAAIILSPSLLITSLSSIDAKTAYNLLGLGLLCTGFAYIFYFKLTAEESPRVAVSVVLLIPVFGTIFGAIIFDEAVSLSKIIGCVTILVSLKFILNLSRANFFRSKEAPMV